MSHQVRHHTIGARANERELTLIDAAAKIDGRRRSGFLRESVLSRAREILRREAAADPATDGSAGA